MDSGRDPQHLEPLLKMYHPNLMAKVRHLKAPTVPEQAMLAELQGLAIKAFETYDPTRGAALNTHVEKRLQKALRYNIKHQNFAYIPEGQVQHIGPIIKAENELLDQFGRDPTNEEIANHLGMPVRQVSRLQKARMRDVPSSAFESDPTSGAGSFQEQQLAVAENILPDIFPNKPHLHDLFNYSFGRNGFPQVTSTNELAKKLGKKPPQISRMKAEMLGTLKKYIGED